MRLRRYAAAAGRRLAAEGGYSLSELIIVLAILLIVVGALTQLFVSASTAQVDMTRRFEAQQDMRLALDKLRREIHCAKHGHRALRRPLDRHLARFLLPDEHDRRRDARCHLVHEGQGGSATAPAPRRPAVLALALQRHRPARALAGKEADYLTTGQVFTAYAAARGRQPPEAERRASRSTSSRPTRSSDTTSRTTSSFATPPRRKRRSRRLKPRAADADRR